MYGPYLGWVLYISILTIHGRLQEVNASTTTNNTQPVHKLEDHISDLMHLAELYDKYQRREERHQRRFKRHKWEKVIPNYPCFRGVVPIGTEASIDDGRKFGCGVFLISSFPIVYSFGSFNMQDFEFGVSLSP